MSIQRLSIRHTGNTSWAVPNPDGGLVSYADHVAAVAELERLHKMRLGAGGPHLVMNKPTLNGIINAAVAEAEQRIGRIMAEGLIAMPSYQQGYTAGQEKEREMTAPAIADAYAAALDRAREAVADAKPHDFPYIERDDYSTAWEYAQDCMGAAIDALKGGN